MLYDSRIHSRGSQILNRRDGKFQVVPLDVPVLGSVVWP